MSKRKSIALEENGKRARIKNENSIALETVIMYETLNTLQVSHNRVAHFLPCALLLQTTRKKPKRLMFEVKEKKTNQQILCKENNSNAAKAIAPVLSSRPN